MSITLRCSCHKEGGRYDLAIALGILAAGHQVPRHKLDTCEFMGELALTGALRPVHGVLPALLRVRASGRSAVVPRGNAAEAALVEGLDVRVADSLAEVCAWLCDRAELDVPQAAAITGDAGGPDLAEVRGQLQARRALEIAAVGGSNPMPVRVSGATGNTIAMIVQFDR